MVGTIQAPAPAAPSLYQYEDPAKLAAVLDPSSGPPIVWLRRTEAAAAVKGGIGAYYPERALRLEQRGYVVLQCRTTPPAALHDCRILAESQLAMGFGAAALKLIDNGMFEARLKPEESLPPEVRVKVNFNLP